MNTEISPEEIAQQKDAINSMRNALANMEKALKRIKNLEYALKNLRDKTERFKTYCPRDVYQYDSTKRVHESFDEAIESATKTLGDIA